MESHAEKTSLTVIVPIYNGRPYIKDLLNSLVEQDTEDFSIVVSNNSSDDGAINVVRGYTDRLNISVLDSTAKRNKAYALNNAIKNTSEQLLLFIDQDDTVNETYVSSMRRALGRNSIVAAYMDTEKLNGRKKIYPRIAAFDQNMGRFPIKTVSGGSIGIKRDVLYNIGLFNEDFNYSTNDVEFCCRAYYSGYDISLADGSVLNYRFRDGIRNNFKQGLYYGAGNAAISQIYPEVRGDQKPASDLAIEIVKNSLVFLLKPNSRERAIHMIGKSLGQINFRLRN